MDSEKLKLQIGNNIASFRKQRVMTQAELAEKLNYSDKAVSKWERGESVPDVMTLAQIAELFGVGIDALIGNTSAVSSVKQAASAPKRRVNKNVIQMLVSILVWFVALFVYVVLSSMDLPKSWIGFVYAVPVNAIVLLCLRSAWHKYSLNFLLVSLIVWGSLVSLYLSMLIFTRFNIWKLFLLGILGQAAVWLWFRMFRTPKEEDDG
jgi:transcriptional regulator with XRE-family HTH domain